MSELPLELIRAYDEATYQRDGSIKREKVYRYYIGKHGPFIFRTPLETFDELAFGREVDTQRAHLQRVGG